MQENSLSKRRVWLLAIRPKTLPAAIGPVIVGGAFGFHLDTFQILPVVMAIVGSLLLQILSNLGNDYFDFLSGHDTKDRVGPIRVLASGLLTIDELRRGIVVNIILALLVGLYLVVIGGWVILFIGIFSIVFALAYSGGPYPLSSNGLGDIFVFIFFGLIAVNGTFYVQAGKFNNQVILGSIPVGLLITAILVVNNYRDIETDRSTNKTTLAVILGEKTTRSYFTLLIVISYLIPFFLISGYNYSRLILLPLITLPMSFVLIKDLFRLSGPALNSVLGGTARLSLVFSLFYAIGIVL